MNSFILFLLTLIKLSSNAGVPVTWGPNNYFRTGIFSFTPASTGSISQSGTVTYSSAMSAAPSRRVALGIIDFQFTYGTRFYLDVQNPMGTSTASNFGYQIQTNIGSNLKNFRISYLAVDGNFPYGFTFLYLNYIDSLGLTGPFVYPFIMNFTSVGGILLNLSNVNCMLTFQHTFDLSQNNNCYDLKSPLTFLNQSYYEVNITVNCVGLKLYKYGASAIVFDKTDIEAGGYYYFNYGCVSGTNSNTSPLTFIINPYFSQAYMFGLNSFSLSGQTKVKFVSLTGSNTTISSTTNFNLLEFCYWSLKFRTCPPSNPYYCSTDGLCYDICPTGTYVNTTSKLCLACSFTCETCSSSSLCLTCSSSNFRYLNGTSCKPIVGYYENGTAIAAACSVPLGSPCLNCTNNVTCVSCANGYYLSAGQCSICSLNCLACTGSLACTSCSSSYILVSGQCIISNSTNSTTMNTTIIKVRATNSSTANTTNSTTTNTTTNSTTNATNSTTNTINSTTTNTTTNSTTNSTTNYTTNFTTNSTTNFTTNSTTNSTTNYTTNFTTNSTTNSTTNYTTNFTTNSTTNYTTNFTTNYTTNFTTNSTTNFTTNATNSTTNTINSTTTNTTTNSTTNGTNQICSDVNCVSCSFSLGIQTCSVCLSGFTPVGSICNPMSNNTNNSNNTTNNTNTNNTNSTNNTVNSTCLDNNCLYCPTYGFYCQVCTAGYYATNGQCGSLCGDGIPTSTEECDDGNSNNNDGCSSSCTVQTNFICQQSNTSSTSKCYYLGEITINKIFIDKIAGENKIEIKLEVSPSNLAFWDTVDFKSMIVLTKLTEILDFTAVRNADGTFTMDITYGGNLQNKDLVVQIDPALSGLDSLSRAAKSSVAIPIVPNDNELADFYTQQTYSLANLISKLSLYLSLLGLFMFIIGIVSAKVVGVEMMAVLQISFFALATLSEVNPCFAALSPLAMSNGYNKNLIDNSNYIDDINTPIKIKGIMQYSQYVLNTNLSLVLIVIPLILALIFFIASKAFKKEERKKYCSILSSKFLHEYTFTSLMFLSYLIAFSFMIQIVYGMKSISSLLTKISLVECGILTVFSIFYLIKYVCDVKKFGQFSAKFNDKKWTRKFYTIMQLQRWVTSAALILTLSSKYCALSVISICAVLILTTAIFRPFAKTQHNVRFAMNMIITVSVMAAYLFYSLSNAEQKSSKLCLYLPLIIIVLLLICIVYSSIFIIVSIVKSIRDKKYRNLDKQIGLQSFEIDVMKDQKLDELTISRKVQNSLFSKYTDETFRINPSVINSIKDELKLSYNKIAKNNDTQIDDHHLPPHIENDCNFDDI